MLSRPGMEEPILGDYLGELTSEAGNDYTTKIMHINWVTEQRTVK